MSFVLPSALWSSNRPVCMILDPPLSRTPKTSHHACFGHSHVRDGAPSVAVERLVSIATRALHRRLGADLQRLAAAAATPARREPAPGRISEPAAAAAGGAAGSVSSARGSDDVARGSAGRGSGALAAAAAAATAASGIGRQARALSSMLLGLLRSGTPLSSAGHGVLLGAHT
eukprot:364198-Chlamydomonas_euryale.AAC.5